MSNSIWAICLLVAVNFAVTVRGDVVLHIKSLFNRTSVVKESFYTNVPDNTVVIHYQLHGGHICYAVYDFDNELKIFKVDVFGEPELGEKHYQSICFLKKLKKDEFIPTEAMSKLRQKTSGTIQQPNERLPVDDFEADVELRNAAEIPGVLGDKFDHLCSGRGSVVYAREADLLASAEGEPEKLEILQPHMFRLPSSNLNDCAAKGTLASRFQPCRCRMPFFIPWYPCVIKYCTSTNSKGEIVTTRCGIRSCSATHRLGFVASHPSGCHWGVT